MKWEPGMMVGDQVRLVEPIGAKPGGNVWLADQLDWRKKVVVKLVTSGVPLEDLEALVLFIERTAAGAVVESPRAVQTYDHGLTDEGYPYVVMERLVGEDLEARLERGRPKPVEAGKIVAQIAEVLSVAHAAGVVHAGLEPGNVFLCKSAEEPDVKVLNFGVAKARPPRRTSNYIAPEQYLLKPADYRSDLFSLAVLAYELLTGEPPITLQSRRQRKWDFTPPSEMWLADIPDAIDQWFVRGLAKQAEDRFESASELGNQFIELMPGIEGKLEEKKPAPVEVGAHKVIQVGTPGAEEEPQPSEPEALSIDVDD